MKRETDRQSRAQEILRTALQMMVQDCGVVLEPVLQIEAINESYATTRAAITLKLVPDWKASSEFSKEISSE